MDVLSPQFFWGKALFMRVPPLQNNTQSIKTSVGKYLVKICPAVAEQSRQNKNTEREQKHKTSPSLAASGAV